MKLCSVEDCFRSHNAKGLCVTHYKRWRDGDELLQPILEPSRIVEGQKLCIVCERWFDLDHYEANRKMCRECRSIHRRASRLSVPFDELRAMVARGKCSVCDMELTYTTAQVDHCHATGRVRGILCTKCNLALGYMDDDEERILALAEYLRRHR